MCNCNLVKVGEAQNTLEPGAASAFPDDFPVNSSLTGMILCVFVSERQDV